MHTCSQSRSPLRFTALQSAPDFTHQDHMYMPHAGGGLGGAAFALADAVPESAVVAEHVIQEVLAEE